MREERPPLAVVALVWGVALAVCAAFWVGVIRGILG